GFDYIFYYVSDLDRAISFYPRRLGSSSSPRTLSLATMLMVSCWSWCPRRMLLADRAQEMRVSACGCLLSPRRSVIWKPKEYPPARRKLRTRAYWPASKILTAMRYVFGSNPHEGPKLTA